MSWCDDFLLEQAAKKLSGQEVVSNGNPQIIINGVNTCFSGRCWEESGVRIADSLDCAYWILSGEKSCSDLGIFCNDIGVSGDLNGADVVLMANGVNTYCEAPLSAVNRYAKANLSSYPKYPKKNIGVDGTGIRAIPPEHGGERRRARDIDSRSGIIGNKRHYGSDMLERIDDIGTDSFGVGL